MINNQMAVQAVVVPRDTYNNAQTPMRLALFSEDGTPINLKSGSDVVLTGYTEQSAGPVQESDSVIQAIAKLEARITALEAATP